FDPAVCERSDQRSYSETALRCPIFATSYPGALSIQFFRRGPRRPRDLGRFLLSSDINAIDRTCGRVATNDIAAMGRSGLGAKGNTLAVGASAGRLLPWSKDAIGDATCSMAIRLHEDVSS